MSKIFLHLGAHKTATTFIQENLAASRKALKQQNCKVVWLGRDHPKVDDAFRDLRTGESENKKNAKLVERFFARLREIPLDVFFTSERPIGQLNLLASNGVLYPNIAENMRRLKEGFEGREITVGFAVRNLADFIESSYTFLVGRGATTSFADYLSSIHTDRLSWTPVIEELASTFDEKNLRIWKYEDFKKSPLASLRKIIEAAGLDVSKLPPAVTDPANVSIPRQTIPIALEWNKLVREAKIDARARKSLLRQMRTVLAEAPASSTVVSLMSDAMRAELTARYENEMKAVFARWPCCKLAVG